MRTGIVRLVVIAVACTPLVAGDITPPAQVMDLDVSRSGIDVDMTWSPVTLDINGSPETVERYAVYRSDMAGFETHWLVDHSEDTEHTDPAAADDSKSYFYQIVAIDAAGNESPIETSSFESAPVLSGGTTGLTIELSWSAAIPEENVSHYEVHYGVRSRNYDIVVDVGTNTSYSLPAEANTGYFAKVVAVDDDGNRAPYSNEYGGALNGTLDIPAQNLARLCPSYGGCTIKDGEIPRSGGQEVIVPIDLPEGDWVNAVLTFTVESNLCGFPIATNKCVQGNVGGWDGWNPCGDPWDRTASVTLALDCVQNGGRCHGNPGNIELLRTITPFGTDAPPPDGSGIVPPRVWTYDITPLAPLLEGRQYLATMISTWVPPGWLASAELHVSTDPTEASPKPPATGIIPVQNSGSSPLGPLVPVTIPPEATQVFGRLFVTGHGDGEFTNRQMRLRSDDHIVWQDQLWRTDCGPINNCGPASCKQWNACGCPSCTFSRAGWCPGLIACHDNAPCDNDLDLTAVLPAGFTWDVQFEVMYAVTGSWPTSLLIYWY